MASGSAICSPSSVVDRSTWLTSVSTRGAKRSGSKSAVLARSVISRSAPPSTKSNTMRGRWRAAARRRSSTLA
jgi:hypothetical protein